MFTIDDNSPAAQAAPCKLSGFASPFNSARRSTDRSQSSLKNDTSDAGGDWHKVGPIGGFAVLRVRVIRVTRHPSQNSFGNSGATALKREGRQC
jgi:hypothetical protein